MKDSNVARLLVDNLEKQFHMHLQNNAMIKVFSNFSIVVGEGDCLVLAGPSGMGKSTFLKCLYGNYKITSGSIKVLFDDGEVDIVHANSQWVYYLRQNIIGYVSQFLRIVPRVPAIDIVMEPLLVRGVPQEEARSKAESLLNRLNIPQSLWALSPTTFSGGEQQRINIARGFIAHYPILLLDEPTASLDASNRKVVIELIQEAKANGVAIVGIFHDEEVRDQVANRVVNLSECAA
ncbi:MAG: phosphonate C-P lyase system protein PhnL [Cellvibrionaceae bacterium]